MPVDSVVNLDKPKGITSQDAVTKVKRIYKAKKAGHAGTLDPLATGVLLVCLGEATKISRFLMAEEKEYLATIKFGERTDTLDAEGEVVETSGLVFGEAELREALEKFRGRIRQTPPMYSAIKVNGKPLYKLARKGLEAERPEREVEISELELEGFDYPYATVRVVCSKGTYIRTLCDDIGLALGTVAYMAGLRRTRVGFFRAEVSAKIEELPGKESAVVSTEEAIGHLAPVDLDEDDYARASHGRYVEAAKYGRFRDGEHLRLRDSGGAFFAIGRASRDRINIDRIIHTRPKPQAKF